MHRNPTYACIYCDGKSFTAEMVSSVLTLMQVAQMKCCDRTLRIVMEGFGSKEDPRAEGGQCQVDADVLPVRNGL